MKTKYSIAAAAVFALALTFSTPAANACTRAKSVSTKQVRDSWSPVNTFGQ